MIRQPTEKKHANQNNNNNENRANQNLKSLGSNAPSKQHIWLRKHF